MPLHLRKRSNIWHYSRTVPADVRGMVGLKYWRFSLNTTSLREAETARSEWDAKHQRLIDELRSLSPSEKMKRIRTTRRPSIEPTTIKAVGQISWSPKTQEEIPKPKHSWALSRNHGTDEAARTSYQLAEADALATARGLIGDLSATEQKIIADAGGLERFNNHVKLERERLDLFAKIGQPRTEKTTIQREVEDRLLSNREAILGKLGLCDRPRTEKPEQPDNPRILTALEVWLSEKPRAQSTEVKYRLHIGRLADFTHNTTIKSLTPEMIKSFVQSYAKIPNARGLTLEQRKLSMKMLLALATKQPDLSPMGAENVIKMCDYLKAFLKGIDRADLCSAVRKPADPRPLAVRNEGYPPFTAAEMKRILPAVNKTFGPDSDIAWWIWLLAYSGARPEEAAQLARDNIKKVGNVWAMTIDDRAGRRIKNHQSARTVPIHPKLVRRGFPKFAHPNGSMTGPVFGSFSKDDKDGLSNNPSRRLKRLLKTLGIAEKGSAHRFRATFIDAARNAELTYAVETALVGHSDSNNRNHGRYGDGANLATLARNIGKINPLADPPAEYA